MHHMEVYKSFNEFIYHPCPRIAVNTMLMFTALFEAVDFSTDEEAKLI